MQSTGGTDLAEVRDLIRPYLADGGRELAAAALERQYARQPALAAAYGPKQRDAALRDAVYNLSFLLEAAADDSPGLFAEYVAWLHPLLERYGVSADHLTVHLECLGEVLRERLPAEAAARVEPCLRAGILRLGKGVRPPESFLGVGGGVLEGLARLYLTALLKGDRRTARRLVLASLEGGTDLREVYLGVFQRCQWELGRLWQLNQVSVAQEHYCTAATQLIMSELYPRVFERERTGRTLVAASVEGELHEMGVRMVSDFLEMEGWDTYYLGAGTPLSGLIDALAERKADALALSATMTFHVGRVEAVVRAVRERLEFDRLQILVGGLPFNLDPDLWRKVGADGTAPDASGAVGEMLRLLEGGRGP